MPAVPYPSNANKILTRIAEIALTVPNPNGSGGLTAAYDTQPAGVPSANCPFMLIQAGARRGNVTPIAVQGQLYVDDPFNLVLCAMRREAEATLQMNQALVLQWRDAVLATFAQHLQLSPADAPGVPDYADFIIDSFITDWLGPIDLTLGQTSFMTLQFAYTVREHQVVTYAG